MKQVGCIKLIGAECSDGILITDFGQSITWANSAALAMHQVTEPAELGATIDEYHTRFQIRYLAVLPQATECVPDVADHQYGRSYPEVLMEINFPSQILPHAVLRMRKVVLFDELGYPDCMVFIMRKTTSHNAAAEKFSELLTIFSGPAAITHAGDGMVVAANAAYLKQSASNPAMQKIANFSAIVEIDGEAFRLIHEGQVADTVSVSTSSGLEQSAASGVVLLDATRSITLDAKMRIVDVSQLWAQLAWLHPRRRNRSAALRIDASVYGRAI